MVKVYAVDIQESEFETQWLDYISSSKRQTYEKMSRLPAMIPSLVGELLVRSLAVQYLGVHNRLLQIKTTERGKPYLAETERPFHFNLSHSGDWVVCAVARKPVGIDVQLMEPVDLNLAKNILTPRDYQYYLSLPSARRPVYFYDLWTRQESRWKLTGEGLSVDVINPTKAAEESAIFYKTYPLAANYRLTVCAFVQRFASSLTYLDITDLLRNLS